MVITHFCLKLYRFSFMAMIYQNACPPLFRWTHLTESGNFYGHLSSIILPDSLDMKSSLRGRSRNQFISVSLRKRITCWAEASLSRRGHRERDYNDLNLYPRVNCRSSPVRLFETLIYLLIRG